MGNEGKANPLDIKIQGLIDRYLHLYSAKNSNQTQTPHLDEDSLAAFVEGNLGERETTPIVNHLVACSFCRHVTAELIKLDLAFAEEPLSPASEFETQPTKISEVLGGLLSKIFGSSEGAVFAHQEEEKDKTSDKQDEQEEK